MSTIKIEEQQPVVRRRRITRKKILRSMRRRFVLWASAAVLIFLIIVAVEPTLISGQSPTATSVEDRLVGPSFSHLMGTDGFGRDVASRASQAIRSSLILSIGAVAFSIGVGGTLGAISGFLGSWFDLIFQRMIDALMAIPNLVLAIVVLLAISSSTMGLILAIGFIFLPSPIRVARSGVLQVKSFDYVLAAESIGASRMRVLFRHIGPSLFAPLMIIASVELGSVILVESGLAFLGFGKPPPTPTLGGILSVDGRRYMEQAPWLIIGPGVILSMLVLTFNMAGDELRDILDPRLRGTG